MGKLAQFKVNGLSAFQELALVSMPNAVRKKASRGAVSAGGKIVVKAMKRNSPKETGLLRVAYGQRNKNYPRQATAIAVIGPRSKFKSKKREKLSGSLAKRKPSKYAHLVEFGTAAHGVRPKNVKVLRWEEKSGVAYFARAVRHPGTSAQEPMTKAWRSTTPARNAAMSKAVWKVIRETARKSKQKRGRPRTR